MEQELKLCRHCLKDHDILTDCYLCNVPHEECVMTHQNGKIICPSCTSIFVKKPIEKKPCVMCFEKVELNTLPCNHELCLKCFKHIYIGYTYTPRPKHCNEVTDWSLWPYDVKKFDEYCKFEDEHEDELLLIETFEEYVSVRDKLKPLRPDYMNTEEMIEYENERFKYDIECKKIEELWDEWKQTKIAVTNACPLCRSILK